MIEIPEPTSSDLLDERGRALNELALLRERIDTHPRWPAARRRHPALPRALAASRDALERDLVTRPERATPGALQRDVQRIVAALCARARLWVALEDDAVEPYALVEALGGDPARRSARSGRRKRGGRDQSDGTGGVPA